MSPTDAIDDRPSAGQLANNAMMVGMLQSALSQLDMGLGTLPDLLIAIDADHCWRAFKFPDSPTVHTHNAADFRVFIESERPAGFICKAITIPADAVVAGRRLARHFTREQFSELVSAALDVYEPRPP
jgi:hypothetical protein